MLERANLALKTRMSATGYISDTEGIVKVSWSLIHHGGVAEFELLERPPLPPALSAKGLPGGRTQILNVRRIQKINRHSVESDQDSAPRSISDSYTCLNWNGDMDNSNDSEEDCATDDETNIEHNNGIEDKECREQ